MPWHIEMHEGRHCVIKDADGSTEKCHDTRQEAMKHMRALYASEGANRNQLAPVEFRSAAVADVNYGQRVIEVVVAPYGGEAFVEYRGELWAESFERGAFNGIEKRPGRIKANRDHDKTRLVGKAQAFWPEREEGLIGAIKIAQTELGDETLQLAREDVLEVSAGFGVRGRDQVLDRANRTRKIRTAFLDHVAFVSNGAYEDAKVLDVRKQQQRVAEMPPLDTPHLDEVVAWLESRRVR